MMEPVRLWRDPQDGEMRESWPCCDGMTEYAALPRADFDALVKQRDEANERADGNFASYRRAVESLSAATARADALAALLKEARGTVGPFMRLLAKSYEIVMPSIRGLFALSRRRHRVEAVLARIDAELGEANTPASSLVEKRRSFLEASMAVMKDARSGGGNNLYINTVNDGLLDAQDKAYDELIAEMKRMGIPTP